MVGERKGREKCLFYSNLKKKRKNADANLRKFYSPTPGDVMLLKCSRLKDTCIPLHFRTEVLTLFKHQKESLTLSINQLPQNSESPEMTSLRFLLVFESLLLWFSGVSWVFGCLLFLVTHVVQTGEGQAREAGGMSEQGG